MPNGRTHDNTGIEDLHLDCRDTKQRLFGGGGSELSTKREESYHK